MFEKIHKVIIGNGIVSSIYNSIYTIVETQFEKFKETLSEKSYNSITGLIDQIAGITLILLTIYVIYSIFHFFYSLIIDKRFKPKVLVSVAISLPFLIVIYVIYAYLNIT